MTTESTAAPSGAPSNPAPAGTQASATNPAPAPGSPEHKAAMIAAYDAQFVQTAAAPEPPVVTEPPKTDETLEAPKLTDPPADEVPKTDPPAEDPPKSASLGDMFKDGSFQTGFAAEKLPDNLSAVLKAAGLDDTAITEIHSTFRAGQAAVQREMVGQLHTAAGGKDQFNALVAWGQKNLSVEQREYFDGQLNGPMAAEAIAVLRQRMTAGADPSIALGRGTVTPTVTGFRSQAEVTSAMGDPRYWTDSAYHNDVKAKLKASTF